MIVNAAGLYAQSLAHKLQGLPADTIPQQYLARGHYCTMEGQSAGCLQMLHSLHLQSLSFYFVHGTVLHKRRDSLSEAGQQDSQTEFRWHALACCSAV